jgi:type IV pilus assembly protein PilQ
MRKHLMILFVTCSLGLFGCATTPSDEEGASQDVVDATSEIDPGAEQGSGEVVPETTEGDLAVDTGNAPPPESQPVPTEPSPGDTALLDSNNIPTEPQQNLPPPPVEMETPAVNEKPARVTGLEFNANLDGGTIVVKTNKPVQYKTRTNPNTNQYVIELENTLVPKRFRRPYNTKEFEGPIAGINAYQSAGNGSTTRIVVQLKEAMEPAVSQAGNTISIASSGAGSPSPEPEVPMTTPESDPNMPPEQKPSDIPDEDVLGKTTGLGEGKSMATQNEFLSGNVKYYGRPISLELKEANIQDVFRLIAEESGLNIVVGEEVTGKITLKLKKIPWDQALLVILQSKQLGYVKQGSILRIAPLRVLQQETDAARNVIEAQRNLQPLRVQLFPISYAKAEELEAQARDFLSTRGRAKADKRTNTLVVTDIDENLTKIKKLVVKLDTQTPQVLIEAKVVEARESFQRLIGVNWSLNGSGAPVGVNESGQNILATPRLSNSPLSGKTGDFAASLSVGSFDIIGDLEATLQLLEAESLIRVISAPRIVTLDRVDAKIEQTTQIPYLQSSGLTVTGQPFGTVGFQDIKLQLSVTPQITSDASVIMKVDVLREFPGEGTGSNGVPINRRQATTQVLVDNGDTVVIGGIYQSDVSESERGFPLLRKIPLIGYLFKSKELSRQKNELVIFLTPRILNREKAFIKTESGT